MAMASTPSCATFSLPPSRVMAMPLGASCGGRMPRSWLRQKSLIIEGGSGSVTSFAMMALVRLRCTHS